MRLGVVEGDTVIDLQAVDGMLPSDLGEVLAPDQWRPEAARRSRAKRRRPIARRPLAGLKFALPVARPGKIICLGLNYLDHVKEGPQRDNIPKFPSIFFRVLTSLVPHLQPLMRPRESIQLDYEGELVAIIGKRAKHLTWTTQSTASPAIPAATKARCANSSATPRNGAWARISTAPAASGRGW